MTVAVVLVAKFSRCQLKCMHCMTCREWFTLTYMTKGLLRFMIEAYFGLLVSSVLFIGMLRTREIWNIADKISFTCQIVILLACALFTIFCSWFSAFTVRSLLKQKTENRKIWHKVSYKPSKAIQSMLKSKKANQGTTSMVNSSPP